MVEEKARRSGSEGGQNEEMVSLQLERALRRVLGALSRLSITL